jgi:hypothetical protein
VALLFIWNEPVGFTLVIPTLEPVIANVEPPVPAFVLNRNLWVAASTL